MEDDPAVLEQYISENGQTDTQTQQMPSDQEISRLRGRPRVDTERTDLPRVMREEEVDPYPGGENDDYLKPPQVQARAGMERRMMMERNRDPSSNEYHGKRKGPVRRYE